MANSEISRLRSKVVYRNRWMEVREDTVRYGDGSQGIYGVVDKRDFALIIPVHDDASFQLVQQFRYPVGGRYWEFPQGAWETGVDGDPADVAAAELEQETGFRPGSLKKLGHLYEAYGFASLGFHVFLAVGLVSGTPGRDREEQGMVTASFTRREVDAMILSGRIKDAPTIASLGLLDLSQPGQPG